MSLISEREQVYFFNWAKTAESHMAEEDDGKESYFEERKSGKTYLVEYIFDTPRNMDEMIQKLLGDHLDENLRKVCEVAALKERSVRTGREETEKQSMTENGSEAECQIPEFIYNF